MICDSFYDLLESILESDNLIVIIEKLTYLTEIDKSFEPMLQGLIDEYKDCSHIKFVILGSEIGMHENLFSHSCL